MISGGLRAKRTELVAVNVTTAPRRRLPLPALQASHTMAEHRRAISTEDKEAVWRETKTQLSRGGSPRSCEGNGAICVIEYHRSPWPR